MESKLSTEAEKEDLEEEVIDLKGDVCPYPLIMAIKRISEVEDSLRSGRIVLKLVVDHPPSTKSIPRETKKRGYQTELEKTGAAEWVITVKR
ncbi:MAG TPA: sulfurtransferase TusA family protein [Methanophagales archaeon]|nr:sulfurtransferase TusA family protein [Methanophagales archaeon]